MKLSLAFWFAVCVLFSACKTNEKIQTQHQEWKEKNLVWRGVHLFVQSNAKADALAENLPKLAALGINVVIVEVNYSYDFRSHPELRNRSFITRSHAKKLAAAARENGIRLIPELDCLGHQSGRRASLPLLARYPEFTEPLPSVVDTNTAYMQSWCPLHPAVNKVVFKLIDEIAEGFDADAFHVGMDEVFRIASDTCPRCRDKTPAELFAKAANDLHDHVVGERKMEMLMWGDRLLDANTVGYGKWEASKNRTHGAIDLIPKDIFVCDWHYEKQTNYPSVPLLLEKGFRVWPSGWQSLEATKAFSNFSLQQRRTNSNLIGYLCTAWSKANSETAAEWPPIVEVMKDWKEER